MRGSTRDIRIFLFPILSLSRTRCPTRRFYVWGFSYRPSLRSRFVWLSQSMPQAQNNLSRFCVFKCFSEALRSNSIKDNHQNRRSPETSPGGAAQLSPGRKPGVSPRKKCFPKCFSEAPRGDVFCGTKPPDTAPSSPARKLQLRHSERRGGSFSSRPRLRGRAASQSPARHSFSGGGKNPSSLSFILVIVAVIDSLPLANYNQINTLPAALWISIRILYIC
jgi:hypothetical protein